MRFALFWNTAGYSAEQFPAAFRAEIPALVSHGHPACFARLSGPAESRLVAHTAANIPHFLFTAFWHATIGAETIYSGS